MDHIIYLSIGSNLGDRLANLQKSIQLVSDKIKPLVQSSVYETEPWGYSDQPKFLNLALKGTTDLDPQAVLAFLKEVEVRLGRRETFRFGPRVIDLDILFYDDMVLDSAELTIPHPRIIERAFVLVPLAEIAPDFIHPILGSSLAQLKSNLDSSSITQFQTPVP